MAKGWEKRPEMSTEGLPWTRAVTGPSGLDEERGSKGLLEEEDSYRDWSGMDSL